MNDVLDTLVADHQTVAHLFDRYAAGNGRKEEVLREIVRELSVHAALEEQIVYPTMRAKLGAGDDEADAAIDDHQQIKRLLADLEKLDIDSADHRDRFQGLVAAVQEHVTKEEQHLFPRLRNTLDQERLDQLGELVQRARGLMPTHPHPNVPGAATAQVLTAPLASMADHVRDFVDGLRDR